MESNQFTPTRASEPQPSQPKPNKTLPIILSLVAIGVILLVANAMREDETSTNTNGTAEWNWNVNANVPTNTNEPVVIDNTNQPPEVITTTINTSDWKTYRNEELGFEVKYPKTWRYTATVTGQVEFYDSQKVHYLEGSETYLVSISALKLEDDFSLDSWIKDWTQTRKNYGGSVRNVKINNIDAVQGVDYLGTYVVLHLNSYRYYITKVNLGSVDKDKDDIYRAMLLSWRFIK